jgi:cytidine deaminase
MKKIVIETFIESYENPEALPMDESSLLDQAVTAMQGAYAPYSQFKVGAAILLDNGLIQLGSNQENAAYPSGLCAERVAMFAAGAIYPSSKILKIAITAASDLFPSDHPVAPCGACRQSMLEYELRQKEPIVVLMRGRTGKIYRVEGISPLLPLFFHEEGLLSK